MDKLTKAYDWSAVALCGYAGTGKDEVVGKMLLQLGYKRAALGDYIKRDADPIVQARLGFSAFTEDREQKAIIRPMLEMMGEAMGASYVKEHMANLPGQSFNARLMRVDEAIAWQERNHPIIYIERPGTLWATSFERDAIDGVVPYVTHTFHNTGSLDEARAKYLFWHSDQQGFEG